MAKTGIKNVILQGNTYYAELSIPADVRSVFGKRKFRKSLKTPDRQTARALSQQFVGRWKLMIIEARDRDIQDWKEAWKESKGFAETVQGKVEHEVSMNPFTKEIIYDENGEPTVIQSYTPSSEEESHEILEEALKKYIEKTSKSPAAAKKKFEEITGIASKGDTNEYFESYLRTIKTDNKWRDRQTGIITEMSIRFPVLVSISKKEVTGWINDLLKDRSPKTVETMLTACRNYWNFLQSMEAVSDDALPFTGHKLKRDKKAKLLSYREYSDEDVKELLEAAAKKRTQPNLAPLIQLAIYSGMRIKEICNLKVTDIENGIINVDDSKTDAGIRTFPVHPKLKNLIEKLKKDSKDDYLLSGLSSKNKYKNRADAIGKTFGRMKTALDYDERHAFHSFRSTVATKLEQAGIPEGIAADILGHEKKTMSYGLYSGGSSMEQKEKAIKSLKYT